MELEYIKSGDYLIPNLTVNNEPDEPLTKYGLMRRNFLKEHRTGIYSEMMLVGTLKKHCLMIQNQAEERLDTVIKQLARSKGINEALKRNDPIRWVARMNAIKAQAEEIIILELIYT
ncbi:MAG: TnpV protein [Lachnospiraceae bacterium]|nr:TnpV protein [Lachnospiraceae bacterium]